ncbi:MAG: hypothetical protein ACT4QD_16345 [Acidobacteriota bacterium]
MSGDRILSVTGAAVACCVMLAHPGAARQLPLQPARDAGQGVTAAFEGWYQNPDQSYTLLVGYFNRNVKEVLDIPVGPNNRIDPGGPDHGQPTHFLPRRQWGVFTIKVPKDFGDKRLTWTIVANGQTNSIPIGVIKGYQVEPFKDAAEGNEPPKVQLDPKGPWLQGPPIGVALALGGQVDQPVTLAGSVSDVSSADPDLNPVQLKQPPIAVVLSKHRGPGEVKFEHLRPPIADGRFSTTATFAAPGDYVVRVQVNDRSGDGGGGFQCCWTNAHVRVTIKAADTAR